MSVPSLSATAVGFSVPDEVTQVLPADPTNGDPFDGSEGVATTLFTVPAGAHRLVGETKSSEAQDIDLFLGLDANGDGMASADEVVCVSAGGSWEEYCDIRGPTAGAWWILIQNFTPSAEGASDSTTFFYGVVSAGSTGMTVTVPESVTEGVPWNMDIGWNLPSVEPGDVFYGVALLSSDGSASGDVMNLAFDLLGIEAPGSIFLPDLRNKWPAPESP
jgi:hypothetical protein